MGKQIPVVMTEIDEQAFLDYIRGIAEVELFVDWANEAPGLRALSFADRPEARTFWIWNTSFPYRPRAIPSSSGGYCLENVAIAPLIEYIRPKFGHSSTCGRFYWTKYTENQLYDLDAFEPWYQSVIRWVRKHGKRTLTALRPYYLPDACAKRGW